MQGFKDVVISAQEQYRVDMDQMVVDFIQFEQVIEEMIEINEGNEVTAIEIEKEYIGELFENKCYDWASVEKGRLAMLYDSFVKRLASWLLARKRFSEAAQMAKRIVSRNEFEEEANLLLLNIFRTMGDRQSFHSFYERYTQSLLSELGMQPSAKIQQLNERYQ